jgi:hypothetical protein
MTKIIALVAFALVSASIGTWQMLINTGPKAAATVTTAKAAAPERAMISPYEHMIMHGKSLPVEQWAAF